MFLSPFSAPFQKTFLRYFLCFSICNFAVESSRCSRSSSILHFVTANRIYQTITTENGSECASKCHEDDSCSSYNYEYRPFIPGKHVCELSRCGTVGTTLVENERFWFHELRPSKVINRFIKYRLTRVHVG